MAITYAQTTFTRGEITPLLQGRIEEPVYKAAVLEATNVKVLPQGPLARRNGTVFISEVKNSSHPVRFIKYRHTEDTSYILELGNTYMRFYTEGGQVQSGGSPLELTTPYLYTEVQDIQVAQSGTSLYLVHNNHAPQVLKRVSALSWTLTPAKFYPEPSFEYGHVDASDTMTPGATTGTDVTFTAAAAAFFLAGHVGRQIVNLTGTGRASIKSITDTTHAVCTITEAFPSTATMAAGAWKLDLTSITTATPTAAIPGSISTVTFAVNAVKAEDINKLMYINGGVIKITKIISNSQIEGEVQKELSSLAASTNFTIEDPEWSATRGYPGSVAVFENRLFFAASLAEPVKIWGSAPGDFTSFGVGREDGDALSFMLNGGARVSWMTANRELIVGGDALEVSISSGQSSALTPLSILQRVRTPHGSDPQQPLDLPNEVIFTQKSGTKLRSMIYSYEVDSYTADDLSLISAHIFELGVAQLAYAQNPDPVILAVLEDGTLASVTYMRQPSVLGTTLITMDGTIENVATVQNGGVDDIYVQVNRTINGSTKRYVEIFDHGNGEDYTDIFSDCSVYVSNPKDISAITKANPGIVTSTAHGFSNGDLIVIRNSEGMTEVNNTTFTIASVTANTFSLGVDTSAYSSYTAGAVALKKVSTVTGLTHLEGEAVQVKVDGATHPTLTVSSGAITLEIPSAQVTVGLPYTSTIQTLPAEVQTSQGPTILGHKSRFPRPILRVHNSTFPTLNGMLSPSRSSNDEMDLPVPLFSGNIEYSHTKWEDNGKLTIETSLPFPLILIGIFGTVEIGVR